MNYNYNNQKNQSNPLEISESNAILILALWFPLVLILQTFLELFNLKNSQAIVFNYIFSQLGFFLAIIIFFRKKTNAAFSTLPYRKSIDISPYVLSVIIPVALIAQDMLFIYPTNWLLTYLELMPDIKLPSSIWFQIIFACLLPSLFEEFIFRGFLFGSLRKRGNLKAAFLTSIIFALFHGNLAQIVHQFALSMILCLVVATTSNLFFANLIHFSNNLTAVLLARYMPAIDIKLGNASVEGLITLLIIFVIGIVVLYPCILLIVRLGGADSEKKRFLNFFKKQDPIPAEQNANTFQAVSNSTHENSKFINFLNKHSIEIAIVFLLVMLILNTLVSGEAK
ncbi:MAG: CPBP family intramembrane metalloprotease [Christensenellaceae bacterium]|jgi:membrane protease YdiL (CAAX protease family)|nr:CPBP family intramembrane metalloprotease [Christensenellaceae bacterium]